MADLGREAARAAQKAPVHDDSASDPGPHRDDDDRRIARRDPEAELAPGGRIGVVLDDDGQAGGVGHPQGEGLVAPGEVRGEDDRGAGAVHEARRPYADPSDVVGPSQFPDAFGDDARHGGRVRRRSGLAEEGEDLAVVADGPRRNLGSAYVNAYPYAHVDILAACNGPFAGSAACSRGRPARSPTPVQGAGALRRPVGERGGDIRFATSAGKRLPPGGETG